MSITSSKSGGKSNSGGNSSSSSSSESSPNKRKSTQMSAFASPKKLKKEKTVPTIDMYVEETCDYYNNNYDDKTISEYRTVHAGGVSKDGGIALGLLVLNQQQAKDCAPDITTGSCVAMTGMTHHIDCLVSMISQNISPKQRYIRTNNKTNNIHTGGVVQSSQATLIVNSGSSSPSFAPLEPGFVNCPLEPIAGTTTPTQAKLEGLHKNGTMPVYVARIKKITFNRPLGDHTVIETMSHFGFVKVTLFGVFGPSLQAFKAGDEVIFFNLVNNFYGGRPGLKFGNRTAMFRTNGVSVLLTSRRAHHIHPDVRFHILFLVPSTCYQDVHCTFFLCVVLPVPGPGLAVTSVRGNGRHLRLHEIRHSQ